MARQETASAHPGKSSAAKRTASNSSASALLFFGCLLLIAGAAFALAPRFSWQVAKVAKLVNEAGFENGVLLVGGLALGGLGLVARMVASSVAREPEPVEDPLADELRMLSEQLSAKLAQVRTSVLQISEDLTALSANQQFHFQNQAEASSSPDHQQDALFRLAASLDKLNAHLDERIHGIDLLMRSGLENLAQVVHESRRFLEHRLGSAPAQAHAPESDLQVMVDLQEQRPQIAEGTIDFFETMEKLDALSGGAQQRAPAQPQRPRQPQPPFPTSHPGHAGHGEALDSLLPEDHRRGRDERY